MQQRVCFGSQLEWIQSTMEGNARWQEAPWRQECAALLNHGGTGNSYQAGSGLDIKLQGLPPIPVTHFLHQGSLSFLSPQCQCHQLETKCLNTWVSWETFHIPTASMIMVTSNVTYIWALHWFIRFFNICFRYLLGERILSSSVGNCHSSFYSVTGLAVLDSQPTRNINQIPGVRGF